MKITRYPQSCLMLENDGHKIVIDPGSDFEKVHDRKGLEGVNAVLYTHEHPDHFDADLAKYLKDQGAQLFGNKSTAKLLSDSDMQIVEDGEEFGAGGFEITAHELLHCPMPDGSEGPQNTGFLVDNIFFHPGDGIKLEDLQVDNLALPIQGPDVSFRDANDFARAAEAKLVIPIHYDVMGANPDVYKMFSKTFGMEFEICVLADGDSTEIYIV